MLLLVKRSGVCASFGIPFSTPHYICQVVQCWWHSATTPKYTVRALCFRIYLIILNFYIFSYITVYGISYDVCMDTNEGWAIIFLPVLWLVPSFHILSVSIVDFSCLYLTAKHVIVSYFLILWITFIALIRYKYHIFLAEYVIF